MEGLWIALIAMAGVIIAAAAGAAGPLLLARQHDRRLDALAAIAKDIKSEVAAVKTQTDGVLTAAYRSEIEAVQAQAVAMKQPSPDTQAAIRAIEARLVVMRRNLAVREKAVAVGQQLIANDAAGPNHVEE